MSDPFQNFADAPSNPAGNALAITASDTTDLTTIPKAIYVGTGGDLTVIPAYAATATPVTLKNLPSGSLVPLRVRRVMATATTAADIVAFI